MPRPPRRAATAQASEEVTATTPTRVTAHNSHITAAIPPSMLETPTGPRFQTTPQAAPRPLDLDSSLPEAVRGARLRRQQNVAFNQHADREPATTPLNGPGNNEHADESHISTQPDGSAENTGHEEDSSVGESIQHNQDDAKALIGLREISSLATWTLSSAKPGCSLAQLRHPSPSQFWQSDGPQPHTLTLHFFKLVSIVKMRVYLDFKLDESYTPTKMKFFAGMSEGGLVEFASWEAEESVDETTGEMTPDVDKIRGWIDVSLKGVGGHDPSYYEAREQRRARAYEKRLQQQREQGVLMDVEIDDDDEEDMVPGDVLRAMIVQVRITENHQNGKDTHVRGFQVFAKDESSAKDMRKLVKRSKPRSKRLNDSVDERTMVGLQPASWIGEPEIR